MIPSLQRELEKTASQIRLELIHMFSYGKSHHFGGSLSCVELLTCLYFYKMNYSAAKISDPDRDRFIMSKGHAVPTQYAILALLGIYSLEELRTIKQLGSRLQGHPDINKSPGIEAPTGSLGQGLSFANGVAISGKLDKRTFNIFVLVGDGEIQEGQIWEAAMTTAHYKLNNVCVIIDRNKFQSQGAVDELMGIDPVTGKWKAFGWDTISIDGHNIVQICQALDRVNGQNERPVAIIAHTVKGKGVSFMENTYKYHNYSLKEKDYALAEEEVKERLEALDRKV